MFKFRIIIVLITFLPIIHSFSQTEVDSSRVMYGWSLDDDLIYPSQSEIDTNIVNFQRNNVFLKKFISATYLGGDGSIYLSNNFFDRNYYEGPLFLSMYYDNLSTHSTTQYINTRKPYSHLYYTNGDSKPNKQESLTVHHSQNVTEKLNVGFEYIVQSNKGQYKYLNTNIKKFKAYTSYSGERYKLHATYNINKYIAEENGGINDSIYLTTDENPKEIRTNFKGKETSPWDAYAKNKIRYYDGMLSQRFQLLTIGKTLDSTNTDRNVAEPILSHVFLIRRTSKVYTEDSLNVAEFPIYRNTFSNPRETYDSIAEFRISNKIQLDFKTKLKNKVVAGIYGSINHDYQKNTFYSVLDSSLLTQAGRERYQLDSSSTYAVYRSTQGDTIYDINRNISLYNIYLTAGLYGKFWTHFQSKFSGKLYLAGYKAGQTQLNGLVQTQASILNRPYQLVLGGAIENIVPSYQLRYYYSNNYIWEDKLNSVNKISLSGKLAAPSNKFELTGNYALLRNHIYFTDSIPVTYKEALNIISVGVEKEFVFWKFHSYSKLIYQASENKEIVEIPDLIVYNSTYIDHTWKFNITGGSLRTMAGVDIHYTTAFNGYSYLPSLSVFYQDENKLQIGNYPFIDLWLNVYLKRTRFFAKFAHFNSTGKRRDSYHAISYPAYQRVFKFGLSWTFYN